MVLPLTGDPKAFYIKIDKNGRGIKGKFLGLFVRPRFVDRILMEAKLKGIIVDRIEIKVYFKKLVYLNGLYVRRLHLFCLIIL